ncbi:MAG: hypothetical protein ACRC7O_16875 [Fimbriiglobus sp.]
MIKPEHTHDINADTWDLCDNLWLYGHWFADDFECPTPPPDRKLRLVVVASLRAIWPHLDDPRSRAAVDATERYADDRDRTALEPVAEAAEGALEAVWECWPGDPDRGSIASTIALCAWQASEPDDLFEVEYDPPFWADIITSLEHRIPNRSHHESKTLHLALFRDIFPNPFRPIRFAPGWITPTVTALAAAIYADRAWDRMPILADALEEAGCDDVRVLTHCRDYPMHARGCWVVDAVLGKS